MRLSVGLDDATRRTFGQSTDGRANDQTSLAVYSDQMYMSSSPLIPHTTLLVTHSWTMLYNINNNKATEF